MLHGTSPVRFPEECITVLLHELALTIKTSRTQLNFCKKCIHQDSGLYTVKIPCKATPCGGGGGGGGPSG